MDFEEKLVEAVRSFPCLWQTTSKCYRDIRARENAWKEVAQQVKLEVILYIYQSAVHVNISVVLYNECIVGGKYTRKVCVEVEDTERQIC